MSLALGGEPMRVRESDDDRIALLFHLRGLGRARHGSLRLTLLLPQRKHESQAPLWLYFLS